jgi:hypothetical protein
VRPRGAGSNPRQGSAGPRTGHHRALILGVLAAALLATAACAGAAAKPPASSAASPESRAGTRVLYSARVETPEGRRQGFRLAAAVVPPDHLRLEVLGPAGGARLVLATEGRHATALLLSGRRYDVVPATPTALEAWTGLPLGPTALVALLRGHAPCAPTPGTTGDRTSEDPCPDLRFLPAAGAATSGCSGTLENDGGAALASIECAGNGPDGWPEQIRVALPARGRSIELRRSDGPTPALLEEALFAPGIPPGFERADLFSGAGGASLLDVVPDDRAETTP